MSDYDFKKSTKEIPMHHRIIQVSKSVNEDGVESYAAWWPLSGGGGGGSLETGPGLPGATPDYLELKDPQKKLHLCPVFALENPAKWDFLKNGDTMIRRNRRGKAPPRKAGSQI
jgi:hypothetical protein